MKKHTGLLDVYGSWADELKSRHSRTARLFGHGPSIGRAREAYLADMLRRCLPPHLKVAHGAFYSAENGASREQDVLLVDLREYPPLEEVGDFGIYHLRSVRATIEVKSALTRNTLADGLRLLVDTNMRGPGHGFRSILFAYTTKLSPHDLLAAIENTVAFFDHRPSLIVVLGSMVVAYSSFEPARPNPQFTMTAYVPRPGSPDLTLLELLDTLMEISVNETPFRALKHEILSHFDIVASRDFLCPEDRPGTGLGTNY